MSIMGQFSILLDENVDLVKTIFDTYSAHVGMPQCELKIQNRERCAVSKVKRIHAMGCVMGV